MSSVPEPQAMLAGQGAGGWRLWLPVTLGLAAMYVPTCIDLARGPWREEAQAHGPIILAVAAWLAWRQRAALSSAASTSADAAGWLALSLGLALYVVGRSQGLAAFEVGSVVPVLAGVALLRVGWRATARLWFALTLLLFVVPLPGFIVASLTGPLKSLVSEAAEAILYGMGYPVARAGVVLVIGQYQLLVADACSGVNSLFSLAALGLVYLYLTGGGTPWRVAALLAAIVPIALAANILRVLILMLVTFHRGDEAGQGFLHGFAGMTLFVSALLLLLGVDAVLRGTAALAARRAAA